ncbi:MAG: hypothetical protein HZA79_00375 [Sphingobacteriales bacterium]|nr:hypothetical protein [Sphingobacteriales bacterium]
MANKGIKITDFSPHLFWDVDRQKIDWKKNKAWIVKRVLEYGLLEDWNLLKQYYSLDQIGAICKELRFLDERSLGFISVLTGIPKESFRCYILKQSIPPHWS